MANQPLGGELTVHDYQVAMSTGRGLEVWACPPMVWQAEHAQPGPWTWLQPDQETS